MNRALRYALIITTLLLFFYLREHKGISSKITSLRQCRPIIVEKQPDIFKAQPLRSAEIQRGIKVPSAVMMSAESVPWMERNLSDGTVRFDYRGSVTNISLLVLSMSYNEGSWARTADFSRPRTEEDFLDLVSTQVDVSQTAFGFMTASMDVYEKLKIAIGNRNVGRATVIYRKSTVSYAQSERHADHVQYERRGNLAVTRNILMSRTLEDEKHIFWLDSDVIDMTPNLINTMMERADANKEEVGLITARSDLIGSPNYDRNAWGLDRNIGEILLAVSEEKRDGINRRLMDTRRYIPDQTRGLKGDQLGRLDSVGGTSLYIRADLIRNGVNFPAYKIVGTTWSDGGWTGQETEGICYMAKRTAGVNCWSLGESHFTTHSS